MKIQEEIDDAIAELDLPDSTVDPPIREGLRITAPWYVKQKEETG